MPDGVAAVRMQGIAKRFGSVQALRGADFVLAPGEVHALLGENGAGKSTLMQVLFGLVAPERGTVEVFGSPLPAASPRAAMDAGIGMVHQHFSQVPRMSVAENVWLGRPGWRFDPFEAGAAVQRVGAATGLTLEPAALVADLPAGLRQRLEIVTALAREARILLLDEPTAALTPGEVTDLFGALRGLVAGGLSVVLITHRLREALAIAHRVTVLRRGEVVHHGPAQEVTAEGLARAMVGEGAPREAVAAALGAPLTDAGNVRRVGPIVQVRSLSVSAPGRPDVVKDVTLDVQAHEIVAIAAVEGNGQRELMRAIAGLIPSRGAITLGTGRSVGFVPEDRQREGLILDFTLAENLALGARYGFWMDRAFIEHAAALAIDEHGIRTPGPDVPVRSLSGGNQQKVVLARVLDRRPALVVAENPTRGLDIHAMADVHARLRRAVRDDGLGVLFYSTDLDEVLSVGDRVGVMANGRWSWVAEGDRNREMVGAMMLGADV